MNRGGQIFKNSLFANKRKGPKCRVGVIQMTSGSDIDLNYEKIKVFVKKATEDGADLVCLPENFAFIGKNRAEATDVAENIRQGELFLRYRQLAMDNRVWLSLGGFPERHPDDQTKRYCSHLILNDEGSIIAKYRKMHVPDSVKDED